ncbi:hypothetical protein SKAU_G00213010 [Synaphobranchus kaupii]|uniref:Uncharacterized protein n=1 Tax=Synaphobranchus kaupii TaxID=118154 RepID=A0A9Q1IUR3_SYNKA|nr:hypothetical protein SKAU_G00213010 [Synaphobranchus kaupii]
MCARFTATLSGRAAYEFRYPSLPTDRQFGEPSQSPTGRAAQKTFGSASPNQTQNCESESRGGLNDSRSRQPPHPPPKAVR